MTPDERRFWSKVDKTTGPDGCWLWTASKNKGGYGQFALGKSGFLPGKRFNCSMHAMANALTGRTHKHVTDPAPLAILHNGGSRNGRLRINREDSRIVRTIAFTTNRHGIRLAWREVEYGDGRRGWLKFPLELAGEMVKADAVEVGEKPPPKQPYRSIEELIALGKWGTTRTEADRG